jgi:drug/metabolite transporter (DMT)-like permease
MGLRRVERRAERRPKAVFRKQIVPLGGYCSRMPTSSSSPARLHPISLPWQVSYLVLAATWGCSFWWIKLGLEMLAPVQVAFVRLTVGAIALAIVAHLTGARLPRSLSTWRHLLVVALLMNSIPFTLFAVGETHISSILAGIINAMTPLTTLAVILVAFPEEHPTAERVVGLFVGFAGALVVVGIWQGLGSNEWIGIVACLGAVTGYGIAFPYVRRHLSGLPESGVGLATGQILCGAAVLLPLAVAAGPLPGPIAAGPVAAMLGLGAMGSGIAFALNYQVVRAAGSSTASTVTYLTPLFAVAVGMLFLGETVTWNEPLGGLIVVLGVAVAQGRVRAAWTAVMPARRGEAEAAGD